MTPIKPSPILAIATVTATAALVALSGCASIPAYEQERLSRPSMTFSDSLVENATPTLTPQVEPANASSGGAQAAGCSACR